MSDNKVGTDTNKRFSRSSLARLKALEKSLAENGTPVASAAAPEPERTAVSEAPMTAPADEAAEVPRVSDDGWVVRDDGDGNAGGEPTAQQRATSSLEQLSGFLDWQRQKTKTGKPKSFVERQDDAQRVEFDDDPSQPDERPDYALPSSSAPAPYPRSSPGKRAHAEVDGDSPDFDPTQDEGFQTDDGDSAAADRRRKQAPASRRRRFVSQPDRAEPSLVDYSFPGSTGPASSATQRRNPGSAMPPPMPPVDPDNDEISHVPIYQRAKVMAKYGRIKSTQHKPQQVRTPWTEDEENVLLELIEQNGGEGVSYASLKKIDQSETQGLSRRSAEDIRFKARNMKLTMLLAQVPLPQNWDQVVLDKKAMDKLRDRNIPYHQARIRAVGLAEGVGEDAPGA